jgi:hypothetical protein
MKKTNKNSVHSFSQNLLNADERESKDLSEARKEDKQSFMSYVRNTVRNGGIINTLT